MPDEYFTRTQAMPARVRSGPSLRALLALGLLAFLGGAVLVGYLVWAGQINLTTSATTPQPAMSGFATPTPAASQAVAVGGFDQRIAALEQRLARVDLQSAAAEGNTARAEAMLVAFAARRSIERGVELGYLGEQLRMRFGAAQPKAVETVIAAAKAPVTLDGLSSELDSLAPELSAAPSGEGGWDRFKRELSGLFVIRRGDTPSSRPEDRLTRASLLLRTGRIDDAADEVAKMPGSPAAQAWIAKAHGYAETQRALDLIETTALLDPAKLRSASGEEVKQTSPASPVPVGTEAP